MLDVNVLGAGYQKRVSFSNLYDEIIDPENPRYLPVFITQNEDGSVKNDGNHGVKKQEIDLAFGYDVARSSNYLSSTSDPSRFFKFNDFNLVNQSDRTARQLKSQFDFNEKLTKKQKLKSEKLPKISLDKSILRKGNFQPFDDLSVNLNSLAYPHPNSKFQKTADHDDLTFKNTQININLNPDFAFVKKGNIIADKVPPSKKKLSEMTDEEIMALDTQFTTYSVKASDMLADLENSIESSKFKGPVSSRRNSSSGTSPSTKYTKDGINLTNFFAANYPTRPSINYSSIVLQNQHEKFDLIRETNSKYCYPSSDIIDELETSTDSKQQEIYNKFPGNSGFDERFSELRTDEDRVINKTVMIYINGTHHGMNPLNFAIHSNQLELLKNGDELVVFAIIPHDLELLKYLLNVDLDQNSNVEKKAPLVRYKTSSMLDDLEKYNNKNTNSNTNSNNNSVKLNSKFSGDNSKGRSSSLIMSPSSSTSFPKQRSYSTMEPELKRTITSYSTNSNNHSNQNDTSKATFIQKQKYHGVINEKILEIGKKLMEKIMKIMDEKKLILKITLEICSDKIIHTAPTEINRNPNSKEYSPESGGTDSEESSDDSDSESKNESAIYDTDDDSSFENSEYSDSDDDSSDISKNSKKNSSELFVSGERLLKVNTRNSKRRASSVKTIRQLKKLKKRKKLNIKFVIDNVVRIYNPELFIIGTKNHDESFLELLQEKSSQDETSNEKESHFSNSELSRILSNSTGRGSGTVCKANTKTQLNIAEFLVNKTNLHILVIPECSSTNKASSNFSDIDAKERSIDPFVESLKQTTDISRKKCLKYLNNPDLIDQLRADETKHIEKKKKSETGSGNTQKKLTRNCDSYFEDIYASDDTSEYSNSSDDNIPSESKTENKQAVTTNIPTIKFTDVNFSGSTGQENSTASILKNSDSICPSKPITYDNDRESKNSNVHLQENDRERRSEKSSMTKVQKLSSDDKSFDHTNHCVLTNTPPTSTESSFVYNNRERHANDENVGEKVASKKTVEKKKKKKGFFKKMMTFGKS